MNGIDPRDARLRRIFSRLPAAKAPGDFEERVARAVGGAGRHRWLVLPWWVRRAAIPVTALLLVGVISFFVFRGRQAPAVDEPQGDDMEMTSPTRATDAVSPPRVTATPPDEDTPAATPAVNAPGAPSAGKDRRPPVPFSAPLQTPAARAKSVTSTPPRLMMEEAIVDSAIADSAMRADSAGLADSLSGRDSSEGPGGLRTPDSAGRGKLSPADSLGFPGDSLRTPLEPPKAE